MIEIVKNKKIPYEGKYDSWNLVETMMDFLDLVLTSDKNEYDEQKLKPSDKVVSFYRNDDMGKIIFDNVRLKHIKSGSSRGLSLSDRKTIYENQSEIQKKMQPKGEIIYNELEMKRTNSLFKLLDDFHIEHLLEFRLNDIAICSKLESISCLYAGCQIKTAVIGTNGKSNLNITYNDMLKYIQFGESIFLIAVNTDETINSVWFLYDRDSLEKTIVNCNCGSINFSPSSNTSKKTDKNNLHMIYMNRFKYRIFGEVNQLSELKNEFCKWYKTVRKMSLFYWNHDNEQILCHEHQMENATNLTLLSKLSDLLIEFNNYGQIDIVIDGCRIQSKIVSVKNSFLIRQYSKKDNVGEHLVYNLNIVDAFICFKCKSRNSEHVITKENYFECYVIPSRKGGNPNIEVVKNRFFINTHEKLGNDIRLFNLDNEEELKLFKEYLNEVKNRDYIET